MKARFTPQAQVDIASIYDYIAKDNPRAAQRVEDHIRAAINVLRRAPGMGVPIEEENVRRLPIGRYPYTVFYLLDQDADELQVLRVMHGARIKDLGKVPR